MEKQRIPYWDAAKGLLIIFVVLAHVVYRYRFCIQVKPMFDTIILLSMPAFVFVSGYLSKSRRASSKESLMKLLTLYCLSNSLYIIWFAAAEGSYQLTEPYYVNWYLIAIVVWRFVTDRLKPGPWSIVFSLLAALAVGFWQDVTNSLALARIICFFPWFLAGYYIPTDFVRDYFIKKRWCTVAIGLGLMAMSLVGVLVISNCYENRWWLTWHFMMNYYTEFHHLYLRMAEFGLSAMFITGFLMVLPGCEKLGLLRRLGRNSLWIFILHRPFTIIFASLFGAYKSYFMPAAFAFTAVLVIILGTDFVAKKLGGLLNGLTGVLMGTGNMSGRKRTAIMLGCAVFALMVLAMPAICGKLA